MTNADRILELLGAHPGLDDDEIAKLAQISPRQQVNQLCRRLEANGLLVRRKGPSGKVCNFSTVGARPTQSAALSATAMRATRAIDRSTDKPPVAETGLDCLRDTLILIPCSGRKNPGGSSATDCAPITDDLPAPLARRLLDARRPVLANAGADERQLLPAWRRYAGMFYICADPALADAVDTGLHILILSGGYGIVKACEPIGTYSTRLILAAWPRGLLEEVLLTYAARHRLNAVRAFVSASTDYCRVVCRTQWGDAGIEDAAILAPETARGAMVKAPRAQGEALSAMLTGRLADDWRSSDGLRLQISRAG